MPVSAEMVLSALFVGVGDWDILFPHRPVIASGRYFCASFVGGGGLVLAFGPLILFPAGDDLFEAANILTTA